MSKVDALKEEEYLLESVGLNKKRSDTNSYSYRRRDSGKTG